MAKPKATLSGVPLIEALETNIHPTLAEYIEAASQYYLNHSQLSDGSKKRAQLVLSGGLARAAVDALLVRLPKLKARATETPVAGALRVVKADVSEFHPLDGLRLGMELKPVNLAVGRALWNRFGDIRTFAVNVHLKFPFAVIGGVLAIPTLEWKEGRELTTTHLIERATARLVRAGGRRSEADAAHLLEGVAVLAYDPHAGVLSPSLPGLGTGLRWDEFIADIATAYVARFEGVAEAVEDVDFDGGAEG
jgi:hypothetical protein